SSPSLSPQRVRRRRRNSRRSTGWRSVWARIWRCSAAPTNHWPPPVGRSPLPVGAAGWWGRLPGPRGSRPAPAARARRVPPRPRPSALMLAPFLGAIALVVAIGARPVVRRLTGRLERLQRGVESLGAGDLTARVKVEGRDEVARLARSFNQAAARIESLV